MDEEQLTRHHPHPARAAGVFTALVVAAATVALALERARPVATGDTASSEGLLLAAAWWLALLLLAWLAASTAASCCARTTRAWRGASWLDVATLPFVRRLLDRALAVTIVTSAVVPMAARAASAATSLRPGGHRPVATAPFVRRHAEPEVRRHAEPIVRGTTTTTTTAPPAALPLLPATPPAPLNPPTRTPRGMVSGNAHVVLRDDNLWTIAAAQLASHGMGRDDATIERYWRRVIDRNRALLRSHDVNLIFPGEVIWLPPVDRAG